MGKNFIVLDTETAPTVHHWDKKAHPETSLVYDMGWVVVDGNTFEPLQTRSFIIADTFTNHQLMNSAYYAKKLPQYIERGRLFAADWFIVSFYTAWETFLADVEEFNVCDVWAWNVQFDNKTLDNTINTYSNGFIDTFLPSDCCWRDAWDYVSSRCCVTEKYVNWAINNGYTSPKGNPSTKAETCYRYLNGDNDFIESHTALDDAKIEAMMVIKAKKRHAKGANSTGQGWRYPLEVKKKMGI